ncbi:MAG TPA: response regulator [Gemmatimonadaceae bacterium]|jgi:two-component system chemotaxis response regulator CheY
MPLNVLIADDSAVMRAMILRTLRVGGLPLGEVHEAGDGARALECVRRSPLDLVLLDVNMPVMTGEEVLEHLRADPATADLRVIVVSTEGSEARIERLTSRHVAFVHKPFTPETLRDTVLRICGISHDDATAAGRADDGDALDF